MRYFANPSAGAVSDAMRDGLIDCIRTPRQGNAHLDGVTWCADNGCFSDRFDEAKWWAWLEANAHRAGDCVFAVAPDVVGNAAATLERSRPWLGKIRDLGYPVAFVGQDGLEDLAGEIPWDAFEVFFIGGSTEWKLGPAAAQLVAEAKARGKRVHMGRVNSLRRFLYAESIGCDSADGTYLTFGPAKNLPTVLRWVSQLPGVSSSCPA